MVISSKLLDDGERVLVGTRTHVKALLLPALVLVVVAGLAGFLSTLPSGERAGTWRLVIWVVALLVVLWRSVLPFLRWLSTTYVFTDRRLITRTGLLTRTGHDIQLNRISDITYEKGLLDRALGCGTLVISDASEMGIRLPDIPRVEQTQLAVSRQLYRSSRPHDDA
ncbi:hypothetical protein ASG49_04710 [Marmoricola sp. Leaf446]|uniref:PH domain-containing protein n=1 Tax=Marmoricola sp. Leaf446 TaxID=1736379 RepID=UPI0006F901DE|nr:PH domain-containing protein [Marmoricola sp. Leaf446]KQT94207.1 hypothetical protein ASG49_04710 [Marmoricola sp. Leaf446]